MGQRGTSSSCPSCPPVWRERDAGPEAAVQHAHVPEESGQRYSTTQHHHSLPQVQPQPTPTTTTAYPNYNHSLPQMQPDHPNYNYNTITAYHSRPQHNHSLHQHNHSLQTQTTTITITTTINPPRELHGRGDRAVGDRRSTAGPAGLHEGPRHRTLTRTTGAHHLPCTLLRTQCSGSLD